MLLHDLLDWIQDELIASRCFTVTNKSLCNLLRKIGKTDICLRELMELSERRRLNLLKRRKPLYLYVNPFNVNTKRTYSIQSKRMNLISQLESVHAMIVYKVSKTELTTILQLLSNKTRLKSLTVKELVLTEGEGGLEEINVIEGLEVLRIYDFSRLKVEGLHLHAYTSLKTVELDKCKSIVDVSGLDGIYDLTLSMCHKIKDISCLNHNYRVTIFDCKRISDLSKSFKQSRHIILHFLKLEYLPIFPSMISLSLNCLTLQHPLTTLTVPNDVKFLYLRYIDSLERIGPNKLQKISILWCKNFKSLENMENINIVELQSLNLTSLSGLGVNNKIVRLRGINSLEDINALKDCFSVSIVNCGEKFLETNNNLEHVKELTLSYGGIKESNLYLPNLQILELIISQDKPIFFDSFRRIVELYPKINKFRINSDHFSVILPDYLKEMFVVDSSRERYIILFRNKTINGSFFRNKSHA